MFGGGSKGKKVRGSTAKSSSSSSASAIDPAAIEQLFDSLAEEDDPDVISMEGIGSLCEQLEIDPATDVRILVLLWKIGATSKPGCVTRKEFTEGMSDKLRKSSVDGLKTVLPAMDPGFLEKSEFRDFFKFVFQFSREGTHKTIEKDVIESLLGIVLDQDRAPHLPLFLEFLSAQPSGPGAPYQRITLDQWDSFLQFNYTVPLSLTGFDDDGAWPLLLDEYVEWRRAKDKERK